MGNSEISARQVHPASEQELVVRSRTVSAQFRRPDINRSYVVPVLSKALRIMRLLEMTERPMSIPQISEATGVAHSTVYRILRTLSAHGYLPRGDHGVYAFRFVSQAETDRERSFTQKRTVGGATTSISESESCLMMAGKELPPLEIRVQRRRELRPPRKRERHRKRSMREDDGTSRDTEPRHQPAKQF